MDSEKSTPSKKKEQDIADDGESYGDPFMLLPEQRLMMRSIPFFVLPAHENTPKTSHITSKVDTHNTSYVPRPASATQARVYSHRQDYSHVKSRVDTGRKTSQDPDELRTPRRNNSAGELQISRVKNLRGDRYKRPSSADSFRFQRNTTSGFPPATIRLASSARKYKNIKSRVGSLDNIHHKPGGLAKVKQTAPPSLQDTATSSSATQSASADYKERHLGSKVTKNKVKAKVKSRIDQSDPNPAHQLKHSLEELTIPEGESLNPRFVKEKQTPTKSPSHLHKSHTFDSISQLLEEEETDSTLNSSLPRSATFDFLVSVKPLEDTEPENTSVENMSTLVERFPSSGVKRQLYFQNYHSPNNFRREDTSAVKSYHGETHAPIQPELYTSKGGINGQYAFNEEEEEEEESPVVVKSEEVTNGNSSEDVGVYDFEVSNSETETTVVLKHILALSSRNSSSKSSDSPPHSTVMPIIEESESDVEEEEEEEEDQPTRLTLAPYTLLKSVPQVLISDEDGSIVENVPLGVNHCPVATDDTNVTDNSETQKRTDTEGDVEPTTQL